MRTIIVQNNRWAQYSFTTQFYSDTNWPSMVINSHFLWPRGSTVSVTVCGLVWQRFPRSTLQIRHEWWCPKLCVHVRFCRLIFGVGVSSTGSFDERYNSDRSPMTLQIAVSWMMTDYKMAATKRFLDYVQNLQVKKISLQVLSHKSLSSLRRRVLSVFIYFLFLSLMFP